jgi:signal transduction histidine kinase
VGESRTQFILAGALIALLGILGFFQYKWLTENSEAERERMQRRLEVDSRNFAGEFNRLIQQTYFAFQVDETNWQAKIPERYLAWRASAQFHDQIEGISLVFENGESFRLNLETLQYEGQRDAVSFAEIRRSFSPINEKDFTMTMPIYQSATRMLLERGFPRIDILRAQPERISAPPIVGYVIIKVNPEVVRDKILRALEVKYFPDGDFRVSVVSRGESASVFHGQRLAKPDISMPMLELLNENVAMFVNRDLATTIDLSERGRTMVFESRIVKGEPVVVKPQVKIEVLNPQANPVERELKGLWELQVSHKSGSLADFTESTRRKNLSIGFGILGLLGFSAGLIFVSARRAQVLAQRQIDFVSSVSHEFRTPIAVIHTAGENLADGVASEKGQVARYGDLIKTEGKRLSSMVEQILEFAGARSGQKRYSFREVRLADLLNDAISGCRQLLENGGFTLKEEFPDDDTMIVADFESLSHSVQNLLTNAIKYSGNSRVIEVSACLEGGRVLISVEDQGRGISRRDQSRIFEPFFRAKDVVDAQIHGNGLGLSLVKRTVEAHNGTVTVKSEPGRGSRFTISLPIVFNPEQF